MTLLLINNDTDKDGVLLYEQLLLYNNNLTSYFCSPTYIDFVLLGSYFILLAFLFVMHLPIGIFRRTIYTV